MFVWFQSINIEASNKPVSILEKESTEWTKWASTRCLCPYFVRSCEELDQLSRRPISCERPLALLSLAMKNRSS